MAFDRECWPSLALLSLFVIPHCTSCTAASVLQSSFIPSFCNLSQSASCWFCFVCLCVSDRITQSLHMPNLLSVHYLCFSVCCLLCLSIVMYTLDVMQVLRTVKYVKALASRSSHWPIIIMLENSWTGRTLFWLFASDTFKSFHVIFV